MIHHCTFEGCLKSVEWPAVFFLPPRRLDMGGDAGARRPRWHVLRTSCEGAGGSLSERRTGPGAKAAYPTAAKNAPMSRIESIGLTRSQGRFANLDEARRALVNPDLRNVVFHFRRGITAEEYETLAAGREWMLLKARAAEGRREEAKR